MVFQKLILNKCYLIFFLAIIPITMVAGEGTPGSAEAGGPNQQRALQSNRTFVPGDAVSISTLPDTASFLNGVFPIDDRGFVELPVYGKQNISQMTADEFVRFLQENFRDYLRFPNLQVKPMIRLSVLGAVARPGFYYFDPKGSLWEVLYLAGGTNDEDGLKDMRWERNGKVVEGNLIPMLQSGISLTHMGFRSGDQIWVKTLGKPGFIDKASRYLTFITAGASMVTLYIAYLEFARRP